MPQRPQKKQRGGPKTAVNPHLNGWPEDGPPKNTPARGQYVLEEAITALTKDQARRHNWNMLRQTLQVHGDYLEEHPEIWDYIPKPRPTSRMFVRFPKGMARALA